MRKDLDPIWLEAAKKLDLPVERGGESYVYFDGQVLHLAGDEHLDDDDTVAQLVFHELCHFLTQGLDTRHTPDWGLDNTTDKDHVNELAALRLQAQLAGWYGLREVLFPTTPYREFFLTLPQDAFSPAEEPSVQLAKVAALNAAKPPYRQVLHEALRRTAEACDLPKHRNGHVLAPEGVLCGGCTWRTEGGYCRQAVKSVYVDKDERGCAKYEDTVDCLTCGACCRSAYDTVEVGKRDPTVKTRPDMIEYRGSYMTLKRAGDRCAALEGPAGGPFKCNMYEDRPRTCRDFELGGRHCIDARRRVGLTSP